MTRPFVLFALLLLAPATAATAQVLESASDATIRRSLCVGISCPDDPTGSFSIAGGAVLRLSDGNTRIDFDDDTTNVNYPNNKWALVANDTTQNGAEYFAIEDVTNGRKPFRVEAGAPDNTLRVTSNGRVGMGTAFPAVALHMVSSDYFGPAIRLESAGAGAQVWQIEAGSFGFFVTDLTVGTVPFGTYAGAPDLSL